jgi:1-acyl-sn-glycerol-3-phosphate acyltransferase
VVAESIAQFGRAGSRILVIAPEGTRSKVSRFRSGFLHIARGAGVPVVAATLDWGARCVRLGPWFDVGDDVERERARLEAFFAPVKGRRPR